MSDGAFAGIVCGIAAAWFLVGFGWGYWLRGRRG